MSFSDSDEDCLRIGSNDLEAIDLRCDVDLDWNASMKKGCHRVVGYMKSNDNEAIPQQVQPNESMFPLAQIHSGSSHHLIISFAALAEALCSISQKSTGLNPSIVNFDNALG